MTDTDGRNGERGLSPDDLEVGDWVWVPGANATCRVSRLPSKTQGGWDVGAHTYYLSDYIWRRLVRVEPPQRLTHIGSYREGAR